VLVTALSSLEMELLRAVLIQPILWRDHYETERQDELKLKVVSGWGSFKIVEERKVLECE